MDAITLRRWRESNFFWEMPWPLIELLKGQTLIIKLKLNLISAAEALLK